MLEFEYNHINYLLNKSTNILWKNITELKSLHNFIYTIFPGYNSKFLREKKKSGKGDPFSREKITNRH